MKFTHVTRLGLLAVASLVAACSENSMAPGAPAEQSTAFEYGGGATADLSPNDTLTFSITIDPSRQTYYDLGSGNSITFPAGSLCDPTKSTYGQGEWDKPCIVARAPVTVAVKAWLDSKGHPRVDFNPNVRFVPSSDPRQWVKITFSDLQASQDLSFLILYCPSAQSRCKDESKSDPTLITYRDPITHKLTRRIKHFSGYNVAAGDDASSDNSPAYSSLSVDSPFLGLAQLAPPRLDPQSFGRLSPTEHPTQGVMMLRVQRPRLVSGYILASG
jgi:hypothetical protein